VNTDIELVYRTTADSRQHASCFVCELNDGRMLVVEYKGEAYATNDASAEKRAIGEKWAEMSERKCLFKMVVAQDSQGGDVRQQILDTQ